MNDQHRKLLIAVILIALAVLLAWAILSPASHANTAGSRQATATKVTLATSSPATATKGPIAALLPTRTLRTIRTATAIAVPRVVSRPQRRSPPRWGTGWPAARRTSPRPLPIPRLPHSGGATSDGIGPCNGCPPRPPFLPVR